MADPFPDVACDDVQAGETVPRRRGVMIAVASILVVLLAGLAWYVYEQTTRPRGGEVPLIKAEERPVKRRPDEPGGMAISNQDKLIYDTMGDGSAEQEVEQLLPLPEEPLPPPTPPRPAAASKAPSTAAPKVAPAPPPSSAPAPPPPKTASPAAGSIVVQLAAFRSDSAARGAWKRYRAANGDLLGKLEPSVERADLGAGRGVYFRLRAGPLADEAAAKRLCERLKARRLDCLVVKP